MDMYESEKYYTTKEGLKNTLEKYGVAILPSILNSEECETMKNGMWDYLEYTTSEFTTPIHRDNQESWKQLRMLYPHHSMLLQWWGIGHAQFVWNLRTNPKITGIFSHLWNTPEKDLLVSFDGASFHMPPEITKGGWYRGTNWLHRDQSYLRNDFECIQSWVTAFDVNPGDATLTFLEGSHIYGKEFAQQFHKTGKEDWCKIENEQEHNFYVKEKGCQQRCISCPAGSMVFWDSRTIHSGREALKERKEANIRCVVYLCYQPRTMSTPSLLKKKQKAFHELRTTSHYPAKPTLFPKMPRTYGGPIPNVPVLSAPIINDLGKSLAGF